MLPSRSGIVPPRPAPILRSMSAALLLLDLQAPFLGAVADGPAVLARCRLAAAAARLLGLGIVVTEQVPAKLGGTDGSLLAAAGPDAAVFAKDRFSALAAPGLLDHLRDREVDHLLLAGVEGPICIHQTAVQALAEGFGVTLLGDAVGARRPADQHLAFEALRRAGATILPVESVFYALIGGADHPRFREFSSLVKEG